MFERKTIQDRLQNIDGVTTSNNKEALFFARLIEEGKVNKTRKTFEKANKGGILPHSDETFEILQEKHTEASEASDDILLKETTQEVDPVIYKVQIQKW